MVSIKTSTFWKSIGLGFAVYLWGGFSISEPSETTQTIPPEILSAQSHHLPTHEYIHIINHTALVSSDLLISYKHRILMGFRKNNPARNTWFTPGVRLYKGETPRQGIVRIFHTELGVSSPRLKKYFKYTVFRYKGCYEHMYPGQNFLDMPNVSTQYFTHAFSAVVTSCQYRFLMNSLHVLRIQDQHSRLEWVPMDAIQKGIYKHRPIHTMVRQFFWDTSNRITDFQGLSYSVRETNM